MRRQSSSFVSLAIGKYAFAFWRDFNGANDWFCPSTEPIITIGYPRRIKGQDSPR
jgi:hypothetical protein